MNKAESTIHVLKSIWRDAQREMQIKKAVMFALMKILELVMVVQHHECN